MTECCDNFSASTVSVDRLPNPIWRAHDACGYKAAYKGLVGTNYPDFVPVKLGAAPGTVEPALDGVGAIGFVPGGKSPVVAGDENLTVVRSAAEVAWADMAPAVGASLTDHAAWWAIHMELAKAGIYVTFG